jgi:hypothetical protein
MTTHPAALCCANVSHVHGLQPLDLTAAYRTSTIEPLQSLLAAEILLESIYGLSKWLGLSWRHIEAVFEWPTRAAWRLR